MVRVAPQRVVVPVALGDNPERVGAGAAVARGHRVRVGDRDPASQLRGVRSAVGSPDSVVVMNAPGAWRYGAAGGRQVPVTSFVVPDQGAVVARSGMTDAPSRTHDPGVVSPGLVVQPMTAQGRLPRSAAGRRLTARRRVASARLDVLTRNERGFGWWCPAACSQGGVPYSSAGLVLSRTEIVEAALDLCVGHRGQAGWVPSWLVGFVHDHGVDALHGIGSLE